MITDSGSTRVHTTNQQWAVTLAAQISEYFQPDHRPIAIEAVSRILAQSEDVKRLVEAAEAALDELLDLHCEYNNGQDVFTYDDGRVCCLTGERIRRWQAALAPFGGGR